MDRRALPALPCPECRQRGVEGKARIGNYRGVCATCNNFSASVRRVSLNRLRDAHIEEFRKLRLKVEVDLYPQVIEDWSNRNED